MTVPEILAVISPTIVILAALFTAMRWVWRRFEARLTEGRIILLLRLDAIEQHLVKLNGSRDVHDRQIAKLEGAVFMIEQRGANDS